MRWRLWISRAGRRIRRRLGLPAFSRRAALLIVLTIIGLAYVSVTFLADFFTTLAGYAPQYYEPKDSQRK